jgi:hypothetical protein
VAAPVPISSSTGQRSEAPVRTHPINAAATVGGIELTLLGLTLVRDLVRVTGVVAVDHTDRRLARVPELALAPDRAHPLRAIAAHLWPQGDLTWLAWHFERQTGLPAAYHARIERITLTTLSVRGREETIDGPWAFQVPLPGLDGA